VKVTLSQQELESRLWAAANSLRGPVDPSDFKAYIFPLLFFRRVSDTWDDEHDRALADYSRAIGLDPRNAVVHSALLINLHYDSKHDQAAIFAEHRRWAERHAAGPMQRICPQANSRDPGRRGSPRWNRC